MAGLSLGAGGSFAARRARELPSLLRSLCWGEPGRSLFSVARVEWGALGTYLLRALGAVAWSMHFTGGVRPLM